MMKSDKCLKKDWILCIMFKNVETFNTNLSMHLSAMILINFFLTSKFCLLFRKFFFSLIKFLKDSTEGTLISKCSNFLFNKNSNSLPYNTRIGLKIPSRFHPGNNHHRSTQCAPCLGIVSSVVLLHSFMVIGTLEVWADTQHSALCKSIDNW